MKTIQFDNFLFENKKKITEIYTGLENGCRCGCHGHYFSPNNKGFTRAFNKAKKLNPIVNVFEFGEIGINEAIIEQVKNEHDGNVHAIMVLGTDTSWVDISLGNGKTITMYF